jgi:hypothetical protein
MPSKIYSIRTSEENIEIPEPEFVNILGVQELIPRIRFRQPV